MLAGSPLTMQRTPLFSSWAVISWSLWIFWILCFLNVGRNHGYRLTGTSHRGPHLGTSTRSTSISPGQLGYLLSQSASVVQSPRDIATLAYESRKLGDAGSEGLSGEHRDHVHPSASVPLSYPWVSAAATAGREQEVTSAAPVVTGRPDTYRETISRKIAHSENSSPILRKQRILATQRPTVSSVLLLSSELIIMSRTIWHL